MPGTRLQMRAFLVFFLLLTGGCAVAATLINKDSKDYDLAVKKAGGSLKSRIAGGATKAGICSDLCRIEIKGVGEVTLDQGERAEIRDGKVRKK